MAHYLFGLVVERKQVTNRLPNSKKTPLSHTDGRVTNSFLPISQPSTRHANQTHPWRQEGIYSPPVNILSQWPVPWCLVGLKAMRTGNCRSRLLAPFTLKALEDCSVVRLKANNVPTAHVHILSGSFAFPQSFVIFLGGKGFSYMRVGRPLCGSDSCEAVWTVKQLWLQAMPSYSQKIPINDQ